MKAVQFNSYGDSSVLEINEVSNPVAGEGQVLVEVYAAGINPIDYKIREGYLKEHVPLQFPVTIGGDFSGIIVALGNNVSNFKIGDEVYGQAGILNGGSGSFAEFAAANLEKISAKPKSVTFVEAGALPLAGVSALQAVEDEIKLGKGQKILIHGGAGGIGSIAIQIAKALAGYVATTVSSNDIQFVKELGADEVIDFKNQNFEEILKDYDAVFDTVGGETTNKSFAVLKKGGIIVSMLGQPDEKLAKDHQVNAIGQNTNATPERLMRLAQLTDSGKIKPQVDKVFPLEQVKEAFNYLEQGHPRGKVVLKVKS